MGTRTESGGDGDENLAEAIGLFVLGRISLGNAAERAGVSRWKMESILEQSGVERRYGPRSRAALDDEIDAALDIE